MLSREDNEQLCRVGPGTLMGNFFREYWIPALQTVEIPEPNDPPVRIKLLARGAHRLSRHHRRRRPSGQQLPAPSRQPLLRPQ